MGCGNIKEKIENEMIEMKMEKVKLQMERRNQIKLLENIDGRRILPSPIPDYLVSKKEENEIMLDEKQRSQSMDITKNIGSSKANSTSNTFRRKNKTRRSRKSSKNV